MSKEKKENLRNFYLYVACLVRGDLIKFYFNRSYYVCVGGSTSNLHKHLKSQHSTKISKSEDPETINKWLKKGALLLVINIYHFLFDLIFTNS